MPRSKAPPTRTAVRSRADAATTALVAQTIQEGLSRLTAATHEEDRRDAETYRYLCTWLQEDTVMWARTQQLLQIALHAENPSASDLAILHRLRELVTLSD